MSYDPTSYRPCFEEFAVALSDHPEMFGCLMNASVREVLYAYKVTCEDYLPDEEELDDEESKVFVMLWYGQMQVAMIENDLETGTARSADDFSSPEGQAEAATIVGDLRDLHDRVCAGEDPQAIVLQHLG